MRGWTRSLARRAGWASNGSPAGRKRSGGRSRSPPGSRSSSLLPQTLAGGGGGGFGMKISGRSAAARLGGGGGGGFGMKISGKSAASSFEAAEAASHGAGMARHSKRRQTASSQRDPEPIIFRVASINPPQSGKASFWFAFRLFDRIRIRKTDNCSRRAKPASRGRSIN